MTVLTEKEDHVLTITMNRPNSLNAISRKMDEKLQETWNSFRKDSDLRVAILTGSGEKAFSTGADLNEIREFYQSSTPVERQEKREREPGLGGLTRNMDIEKPVIAAVNGYCLAGGLELALACDLRIAAEHATFGLPEVRRGIMPGAGGTQRLMRAVPEALALEIILTGEPVNANKAYEMGLVNRVVESSQLMDSARELADKIASNGPLAVQAARKAALKGQHLPLSEGLRLEQFYAEPLRSTKDAKEGVQAFAEDREPQFEGK